MQKLSPLKIGVDTGGTFTDFILQSGDELRRFKCSSTPDDPSEAIMRGVDYFFPDGAPEQLEIVHGTTVGTNAFLERKGGRPLLLTTKGFEDVLALGRQNRASLFDLRVTRPAPIISRELIVGVTERLSANGDIIVPLGQSELSTVEALIEKHDVDIIVVCFLHSFLNDVHERKVKERLEHLSIPILCSVDILPEFREFERCSTSLINGYLAPVMSAYIEKLTERLDGKSLSVQQSSGGVMDANSVSDRAVHTLLSGPAAGVQGAYQIACLKGQKRIVTFDMGGTSTDVSLCDGYLPHTKEYVLDGYPVSIPVLDIHTVGAGGGSIASIDQVGVLQVGPESAGADPGPVCYGKGHHLTVTDANLLLGRLLPEVFLAGKMVLDIERVEHYAEVMAQSLGVSVVELCLGIVTIVNASMVKAVRSVSLDRGYDPADFILYSFGGSSGLHCCALAEELGIRQIEIPARAGVLSAQGLVFAPPLLDQTQALFLQGQECSYENISKHSEELEAIVRCKLSAMVRDDIACESFVDLRYVGQSHEITVEVCSDLMHSFHTKHKQLFGYDLAECLIESVSLRSVAKKRLDFQAFPCLDSPRVSFVAESVSIVLDDRSLQVPRYTRKDLFQQKNIQGPCLILDDYTTILVTSSFDVDVDDQGTLILHKERD